jgi:hypothetical protein
MRSRIYGHGTGGKTGVGCMRASPRVGQYRAAGKRNGSVHLLLALVVGSAIILIGSCVRGATTMSTTRTSRGGAPVRARGNHIETSRFILLREYRVLCCYHRDEKKGVQLWNRNAVLPALLYTAKKRNKNPVSAPLVEMKNGWKETPESFASNRRHNLSLKLLNLKRDSDG